MTLRLIIEHAPHPQRVTERRHDSGDLSIGRGAECDWQVDDPDMFISRKHCVISGGDGRFTVTDASRGGLFLDGRDAPVGTGVTVPLENGSRLRMGDLVIRVEVEKPGLQAALPPRTAPLPSGFDDDDFFAKRPAPTPPPPRPDSLPEPFEGGRAAFAPAPPPRPAAPPLFDDPFSMDPIATPKAAQVTPAPAADFSFGDFLDVSVPPAPPPPPEPLAAAPMVAATPAAASPEPTRAEPVWADPGEPRLRERVVPPPAPEPALPEPALPEPAPAEITPQPPAPQPVAPPPVAAASDAPSAEAFFRGLGLDLAALPNQGSAEEMEALGKRFRLLTEGLVHQLRTRAREKNSVRVAATVIGSADVNPLKFLATTEEALAALVTAKGKGYLPPEAAINAAFRDLNDHQVRTWTALQSALRRMIDRFDPAMFEAEVEEVGLVKSLIAGSRGARLWQLYAERYREIAKSAEDRFLGEVGADFRDAYEGNKEDGK
ncbi:MAG: type VI secretion system-associated FHA domain protein TagH [Paracoccaceae bacterium]